MQFSTALNQYMKDLSSKEELLAVFGQQQAIYNALQNLLTAYGVSRSSFLEYT